MQAPIFNCGAHIHTPVQVEEYLEDGREDTRAARAADGEVERPILVFDNGRGRRGQWSLAGFRVVVCEKDQYTVQL